MSDPLDSNARATSVGITIFATCVFVIGALVLYPVFTQSKNGHRHRRSSLTNLKQIALGQIMYAYDHDEHQALRDSWHEGTSPYLKNDSLYHCPQLMRDLKEHNSTIYGFAYFSKNSGTVSTDIHNPAKVPLVYASLNWAKNASDPFNSLPRFSGRMSSRRHVAYGDGHTRYVDAKYELDIRTAIAAEPAYKR